MPCLFSTHMSDSLPLHVNKHEQQACKNSTAFEVWGCFGPSVCSGDRPALEDDNSRVVLSFWMI